MKYQLISNDLYDITSLKMELSIPLLWGSQSPNYVFWLTAEICEMKKQKEFSRRYLAPFPYLNLLGQNFYLKFPYHNLRVLLIFSRNDWNSSSVDIVLPSVFLSQFYWYSIFCYGDSHSSSNRTSSSVTVSKRPLHGLHFSHFLSYHCK
jgi:hypothetical protein